METHLWRSAIGGRGQSSVSIEPRGGKGRKGREKPASSSGDWLYRKKRGRKLERASSVLPL